MLKNYTLAEIKAICEAHKNDECDKCELFDTCMNTLQSNPEHWQIDSRELVEVVHAHWIYTGRTNVYGGEEIKCSNCGDNFMVTERAKEHELYCRYCGAKMDADGERREEQSE